MPDQNLEPIIFNPETATEHEFIKRNNYGNLRRAEAAPDDPPFTLEASINNAKGWKLIESNQIEVWQIHSEDNVVSELFLVANADKNNTHLFSVHLHTLQPFRRKGYAKLLLPKLLDFANKHKRRLAQVSTTSRIPAGKAFAEHLGANRGLDESVSQLVLENLDQKVVEGWLENAKTVAETFEIGFWGNVYPEEEIQAICELIDVMNTAPTDALDLKDYVTTPERLREIEARIQARADERRVLYVRHKASGELAGYTETYWEPETPDIIHQGGTGVVPKYRGNALGKWLKAAMLEKLSHERPETKYIRTGNAASNEHMLAINHALGFELYESVIFWQIEVDKIRAYLKK